MVAVAKNGDVHFIQVKSRYPIRKEREQLAEFSREYKAVTWCTYRDGISGRWKYLRWRYGILEREGILVEW